MSSWLDIKYVKLVGLELEQFSEKRLDKEFNFRCNVCGDSEKNKFKKRAYIFEGKDGNFSFYCHNCASSASLSWYLKEYFPHLYSQYMFEKLAGTTDLEGPKEKKKIIPETFGKKPEFSNKVATESYYVDEMDNLDKISDLPEDHEAVVYISSRKIPKDKWDCIYYTEDFIGFAKEFDPEYVIKYANNNHIDSRIVIPFRNARGRTYGATGRLLGSVPKGRDHLRYQTIRKHDVDDLKYFGLDRYDPDQLGYCLEGALDSFFLPNCIAIAGANKMRRDSVPFNVDNVTMVFDNEPRNKDICKIVRACIINGFKVCIWPEWFEYKDINDAILGGYNNKEIKDLIDENTFSGMIAQIRFDLWVK